MKVEAVGWVTMSATFEEPEGRRSLENDFENGWILGAGEWYWSPSEE